jgi:hypothetical protein
MAEQDPLPPSSIQKDPDDWKTGDEPIDELRNKSPRVSGTGT